MKTAKEGLNTPRVRQEVCSTKVSGLQFLFVLSKNDRVAVESPGPAWTASSKIVDLYCN